jgi:hypothetical protein
MAGRLDITIEQGATWARDILWMDDALSPIDVSSYTAAMQIRHSVDDTATLVSIASGTAALVVGTTDGKFTVTLSASVTAALDFDTAVYDFKVISPSPNLVATRLLEGTVTLRKAVTR